MFRNNYDLQHDKTYSATDTSILQSVSERRLLCDCRLAKRLMAFLEGIDPSSNNGN